MMRFICSLLLGMIFILCVIGLLLLGANNFDIVFKYIIAPTMMLGSVVFFVVLFLSCCVLCWGIGKYILDKVDKIKYEKVIPKEITLEEFCKIIHKKQLKGRYSSIGSSLNNKDVKVFYKMSSVLRDDLHVQQHIHRIIFEDDILVKEEHIFIGLEGEAERHGRKIDSKDLLKYDSPKEFWEKFIAKNEREIFNFAGVKW